VEKQCGRFLIGGLQSVLFIWFAIPNWDDYPQLLNNIIYIYIHTYIYIHILFSVYIYYTYIYKCLFRGWKQQPLFFQLQACRKDETIRVMPREVTFPPFSDTSRVPEWVGTC
jgi:hypothetical protein